MEKDSTIWEGLPEDLEWRVIPGFKDYEINNYGDIISHKLGRTKYLSPSISKAGYYNCTLCKEGRTYNFFIHQLVLLTFYGPCPPGLEVRHIDGNPSNNHISNLKYGTHIENLRDAIEQGTIANGSFNGSVILTETEVKEIKILKYLGYSNLELSIKFKVHRTTIERISNKKYWRHVNISEQDIEEYKNKLKIA